MNTYKVFLTVCVLSAFSVGILGQAQSLCQYTSDCPARFTCAANRTCVCANGYSLDTAGQCSLVIGRRCYANADCSSVTFTNCESGICACSSGYEPNANTTLCIPLIPNGTATTQTCTIPNQCFSLLGPFSSCAQGICICRDGFHINTQGRCTQNLQLEDSCTTDDQCFLGSDMVGLVTCDDGKCGCKEGYKATEDGKCTSGASHIVLSIFAVLFSLMTLQLS